MSRNVISCQRIRSRCHVRRSSRWWETSRVLAGFLAANGTMTVLQAFALAGGANQTAILGDAGILRKGPTGDVVENKGGIEKILEAKVLPFFAGVRNFVGSVRGGKILRKTLLAVQHPPGPMDAGYDNEHGV